MLRLFEGLDSTPSFTGLMFESVMVDTLMAPSVGGLSGLEHEL
jgi:hypothetical protein